MSESQLPNLMSGRGRMKTNTHFVVDMTKEPPTPAPVPTVEEAEEGGSGATSTPRMACPSLAAFSARRPTTLTALRGLCSICQAGVSLRTEA